MVDDNLLETDRKRYADDVTVQELVRLRVENEKQRDEIERLQEALNQAQCGCELPCLQGEFCSSWICRSALQQKDTE